VTSYSNTCMSRLPDVAERACAPTSKLRSGRGPLEVVGAARDDVDVGEDWPPLPSRVATI